MELIRITKENILLLENLAIEASSVGYHFVQRTIDQWLDGSNDFSKLREAFYAVLEDEDVVSIGGINVDPYLNDPSIGRIRHVYTKIDYRNKGYSKKIITYILENHSLSFKIIRLSTNNPIAAKLYESLGFQRIAEEKATHILYLNVHT